VLVKIGEDTKWDDIDIDPEQPVWVTAVLWLQDNIEALLKLC
jgi:hypothetical protein